MGVILYEMLTGQLPYGSDAPANVIVRLITDEPLPPRRIERRSITRSGTIGTKIVGRRCGLKAVDAIVWIDARRSEWQRSAHLSVAGGGALA